MFTPVQFVDAIALTALTVCHSPQSVNFYQSGNFTGLQMFTPVQFVDAIALTALTVCHSPQSGNSALPRPAAPAAAHSVGVASSATEYKVCAFTCAFTCVFCVCVCVYVVCVRGGATLVCVDLYSLVSQSTALSSVWAWQAPLQILTEYRLCRGSQLTQLTSAVAVILWLPCIHFITVSSSMFLCVYVFVTNVAAGMCPHVCMYVPLTLQQVCFVFCVCICGCVGVGG